jgi:DNA-binding NtrC family response regulator
MRSVIFDFPLKYLDDHEVMRLGGLKAKKIDCTIIAATNRDLEGLVQEKRFRKDLFFMLNTFTIRMPPHRERIDDIFERVSFYMNKYGKAYRLNRRISPDALKVLQKYPFPGNVCELKNVIKKAVLMSDRHFVDDVIYQSLPSDMSTYVPLKDDSMQEKGLTEQMISLEKHIPQRALRCCRTTREMSRFLKISQPSIVRKLKNINFTENRFNNVSNNCIIY